MPAHAEQTGIRDFPQHARNPFLSSLIVPTRGKMVAISTGRQLSLIDNQTGEEIGGTIKIASRQLVDKEEFVKIYKDQIRIMFDLTTRGMKVFGYILHATRVSDGMILFSLKKCQEFTGYSSKGSITAALAELLSKQIIARTDEPHLYFINPAMFFNGDRIVMMRDVVMRGSRAHKALEENDPWANLNQPSLPLLEANEDRSKEEGDA
jgi:hypothetical protein